jgi:hypothetical protein
LDIDQTNFLLSRLDLARADPETPRILTARAQEGDRFDAGPLGNHLDVVEAWIRRIDHQLEVTRPWDSETLREGAAGQSHLLAQALERVLEGNEQRIP